MPIYAYRCNECGEEFEELVMSAQKADSISCPACRSREIERRPTLFGLGKSRDAAGAGSSCRPAIGGG